MAIQRLATDDLPGSEELVRKLESRVGARLPENYRQFLLQHNGGKPSPGRFTIPRLGVDGVVHVLFGVDRSRQLDILQWMRELQDDVPEGFIPIGNDPGGNMILLDISDSSGGASPVYYWDCEHYYPQTHHDVNTYLISPSFSEFIDSLLEKA
jgi:SMI1-KNR4 cell-wall